MSFENARDWQALMGEGSWALNTLADTKKQEDSMNTMLKYLAVKAINCAWTDSGVFIVLVPYDTKIRKIDSEDVYDSFSEVSELCFHHSPTACSIPLLPTVTLAH